MCVCVRACVSAFLQAVYLYRKMILCLLQENSVIVNPFPYNLRGAVE